AIASKLSEKSRPSRFVRNVKIPPPSPQPKQCHVSRSGLTMKEGVFSAWNGQRPLNAEPARLTATVSPTRSATGIFDLISAVMPEEEKVIQTRMPDPAKSVKGFVNSRRLILRHCQ